MYASHEDNHEKREHWLPVLASDTSLYHDNLLGRWVISGANQVIFLNQPTYEVLKHCDGQTTLVDISELLCESGVFQANTAYNNVLSIIQDFVINGFLFTHPDDDTRI